MKWAILLFLSIVSPANADGPLVCAEDPAGLMQTVSVEFSQNLAGTYDIVLKIKSTDSQNPAREVRIASELNCRFAENDPFIFLCGRMPKEHEETNSYAISRRSKETWLDSEKLRTEEFLDVEIFSPETIALEPEFSSISKITKAFTHRFLAKECRR